MLQKQFKTSTTQILQVENSKLVGH